MLKGLFSFTFCVAIALSSLGNTAAEEPPYRRGVNVAGAEFGEVPGKRNTNYTYNDEATFKYFTQKGFNVLRIPIKWERVQPALGGALNADEIGALKQNVGWAKTHGTSVIIDVHNYCRYLVNIAGKPKGCVIDAVVDGEVRVKATDLADLWVKLSGEFKDDATVYGYGLMNEPHDMGKSDWKAISNTVVKAIRDAGDTKLIFVGGDHWSNASGWEKKNGAEGWVVDPANNFIYEAHCYFDSDNSGSYKKSYEKELAANPKLAEVGRQRVAGFAEWCRKNKVRGFLGEFAVPRDDARWNEVLENFMQALDEAGFGGTYWAAGTFWGEYQMSLHPTDKFKTDRPQMQVMLKHLAPAGAAPALQTPPEAQK